MYIPTIVLCLVVWATVIVVRTHPTNPLTTERIFAIVLVAGVWFIIGIVVERVRADRDQG